VEIRDGIFVNGNVLFPKLIGSSSSEGPFYIRILNHNPLLLFVVTLFIIKLCRPCILSIHV
jgi:hypothetical protein